MSLKILAGVYGGRVLRSVRGLGTRPLLGQVRAALFNILAEQVPDAIVWDLFAGTGATGIEALSHGARAVMFCEKNGRAIDVLRGNLQMLGQDAVERSVVMRGDAWDPPVMTARAFGRASEDSGDEVEEAAEVAPDIIFLDPPYAMVAEDPVKCMARARRLLDRTARHGCVVFHFEAGVLDEDDFDANLDLELREWGTTAIAFLWRKAEAPDRFQERWAKERSRGEECD